MLYIEGSGESLIVVPLSLTVRFMKLYRVCVCARVGVQELS